MQKLNSKERVDALLENNLCSRCAVERNEKINIFLNICLAAGTWLFSKNFLLVAVVFIAYDILANFIECVVVSGMISKEAGLSLPQMQKLAEKLEAEKKKRYADLEDACPDCRHGWGSDVPRCSYGECRELVRYNTVKDRLKNLQNRIEVETTRLAEIEAEAAKQEAMARDTKSNNYNDKLTYFKDMNVKLSAYIEKEMIDCLVPIKKSVQSLIKILEEKPQGVDFIANATYIHLDELVNILNQYSGLEQTRRDVYTKQIEKIAGILSKNVDSTIERIHNYDETSLDVGIAVLLSELTNGKE